jgi:hypothetical protein
MLSCFDCPLFGRDVVANDAFSREYGSESDLYKLQRQAQTTKLRSGQAAFLKSLKFLLGSQSLSLPHRCGTPFKSLLAFSAALICLLVCSSPAHAACTGSSPTWTTTIDQSSVSTCIASAVSGDTVNVQSGSATWSTVTIPNSKGIILACPTPTCTIAGTSALIVNSNSSADTRVTGFTFTGAGNAGSGNLQVNGSTSSAYYRIDDNVFDVGSDKQVVYMEIEGNGPGLIDHNTFKGGSASEEVHNLGLGAGNEGGWQDNISPGGPQMVYLENNNFGNYDSTYICSGIESYYGARTVLRYNTFSFCQIDQHGTSGEVGARWWEIYDNTFNVPAGLKQCCDIVVRDGSGVIFSNHQSLASGAAGGDIELYSDNSGSWPLAWQIGAGFGDYQNGYPTCQAASAGAGSGMNSSPAYVWGNDAAMTVDTNGNPSGTVFVNQDFIISSSQPSSMKRQEQSGDTCSTTYSYTPFTYPFPLDANGLPNPTGKTPAPPTGVQGAAQPKSGI